MDIQRLNQELAVSPQLRPADVPAIARAGYRSIICNRPNGEEQGQPDAAEIAAAAAREGLGFAHVPVAPGEIRPSDVAAMREAFDRLMHPVLAYCRSGARAARLAGLAGITATPPEQPTGYDILIIGGGSAGIATAASIRRRNRDVSIAIVEPNEAHYYQPGWTMVGAGVFRREATVNREARLIPRNVTWVKASAAAFEPEARRVRLCDGRLLGYRVLIVCPGLTLDWDAIPGLRETLGQNGVTSNYSYDTAPYTLELTRALVHGRALFTQPPMPIKCAGAPQKAMYLACHRWERGGVLPNIEVQFHTAGAALFGVAAYVPALMRYVERYGIELRLESRLVAIDGPARTALFERKGPDGPVKVEERFDMIHVVPPQRPADVVARSPLAAASGYVAVDEATLRHPRFPEVFSLGDACAASNAKTAAAARKQAPVVAENALAVLSGRDPPAVYDGYGSCPLTVEAGKIVLAEFGYGGRLLPSFPTWLIDGTKPSRLAWLLKDTILPPVYWHGMLKGREWLARPNMAHG